MFDRPINRSQFCFMLMLTRGQALATEDRLPPSGDSPRCGGRFTFPHCKWWGVLIGAGGLRRGNLEWIHLCVCLRHQHAPSPRRVRASALRVEGCRDGTRLVTIVVLTLKGLIMPHFPILCIILSLVFLRASQRKAFTHHRSDIARSRNGKGLRRGIDGMASSHHE